MASPQPTDSHTRISNELYTQILMRDFTKRQRAILDLIIRLSYGCGKKTAYIKMAQFHVCGVDKYHVKKELKSLLKINVIGWDDNSREFWIQKNYDVWKIEPPPEDIKNEMNYLIKLNIADSYQNGNNGGYQIGNSSEESYQNGNSEVTKTVTKKLPKWEPKKSETPCPATDDEVPITKDNYLYKKKEEEDNKDLRNLPDFVQIHMIEKTANPNFKLAGHEYTLLMEMSRDGITKDEIIHGIDDAFERFNPKYKHDRIKTFSYCKDIIYENHELLVTRQQLAVGAEGGIQHEINISSRASPVRTNTRQAADYIQQLIDSS